MTTTDTATDGATTFAAYVANRRPALLRAARAISGDTDVAEDLLQAALVSVCSRWETLRDHRAADGYVRRTMVNQLASWHRSAYRRRECPLAVLPEPDPRWRGEDERGDGHALWPLVVALPPRQRSAVVLRYYEGLSEAETSAVLRCSLGTVKSNTHRGLSTLRRWAHDLDRAG